MASHRLTVQAGIALAIGLVALAPPAVAEDEAMGQTCNEIICTAELECSSSSLQALCFVFCKDWIDGACGFDDECEPNEYAYICYDRPH